MSAPAIPDIQDLNSAANQGGVSDQTPGPTAPPAAAAAGVKAIEIKSWYREKFNDEVAVGLDLMNAIQTLSAATPNESVKSTLDNTIKGLQKQEEGLRQSIAELETMAEQASVPFTEEAAPVTGIARERIFTLQDYILFIFIMTYGFCVLALLVLVGKRTGWSKPVLGKMLGGLVVFSVLGYVLIKRYA
jgi:hypothetical protein